MSKLRIGKASLAAACVSLAIAPAAALAAKPSGGGQTATQPPLSLTAEWTKANPNGPPWCLTEDDVDQRQFSGSLSGSYSTSYRLCGPSDFFNNIWWDAGGIGLESDVYVIGQLSDLTITAPGGAVRHAVLVGQTTAKGVMTSHYAACDTPPYSLSSGNGGSPLAGGTWTVTLSGQIKNATWSANAEMTNVPFQQTYCPSSEQNLVP